MHYTIALSTAVFQLTSALPAAPRKLVGDLSVFERLEGACRTAALTTGTFRTLQGVSRTECESECAFDAGCVAYEYNERRQCELHSEEITQAAPGIFGVTCDIKSTREEPEPEILCTSDTF